MMVDTESHSATSASNNASIFYIATFMVLGLVLIFFFSLKFGSVYIPFIDIFSYFTDFDPDLLTHDIILDLRLPRTLNGAVVGIHMALSGLILQAVLRNPLADPGVLGISAGASLAVIVALLAIDLVWPTINNYKESDLPELSIPYIAFVGALISSAIVFWLGWENGIQPKRLILAGVVFGAFLSAVVMAIIVGWGGGRSELVLLWLSGSLYGRGFDVLWPVLPWTIAGLLVMPFLSARLSLLRFGEEFSQSLGMNVQSARIFAIIVAIFFAATAVSVSGPVGFVGLITPHFARLLVGGNFRHLIWVSAMGGAILVMLADLVSRTIASPIEIPVGAITSIIGVPVFIIILQKFGWKLK